MQNCSQLITGFYPRPSTRKSGAGALTSRPGRVSPEHPNAQALVILAPKQSPPFLPITSNLSNESPAIFWRQIGCSTTTSRRDVVSGNVMIGGYKHAGEYKEVLALFSKMQSSSEDPNGITLLSVRPACAYLGSLDLGKWIHTYVDKNIVKAEVNYSTKHSLYTSLIDMYAKCGSIDAAQQVILSMQTKNLPCFAMHGHSSEALKLFLKCWTKGLSQMILLLLAYCQLEVMLVWSRLVVPFFSFHDHRQ